VSQFGSLEEGRPRVADLSRDLSGPAVRHRARRGFRVLGTALGMAGLAVVLTSCFSGLEFRQNNSVKILYPPASSSIPMVNAPFVMRWSSTIPRSSGIRYAVFFDSDPMGPGSTFRSLLAPADPCRFQPGCPGPSWLSQHQIYVTTSTHIDVSEVALLPGEIPGGSGTSIHEATIILLGPHDVRDGEASWLVEFRLHQSN
jgi:hypothetical protein